MIIGKIKQEGTRLTTDNSDIAYQYSANQVITVEFGDTTLTGYTLCWYCAFDRAMKKTVILEYDTKTKQITLPASVFEVEGNIYIALRAIKEKEVLSSSPVNFYIGASTNPNASNAPREPGWEEVVQALIDDIFKQEYKEPMDAMIEEAKKQQKLAATLETAANNATVATNAANSATTKANEATKKALEATKQAEVALHDQDKLNKTVAEVNVKHSQIMDFMQNTESGNILHNLVDDVQSIKYFIGMEGQDIYGVEVDFPNRTYKRLGKAKNLSGGDDFDNIGPWRRRKCILANDGTVLAYREEEGYTETGLTAIELTVDGTTYPVGTQAQVMVEQPKFYYCVLPITLEPIEDGEGFHMRKFKVYISADYRCGFKVHPAFVRNGIEKDFIYLSAYQACPGNKAGGYSKDNPGKWYMGLTMDMLSSIADALPLHAQLLDFTRDAARKMAQRRGTGWELRDGLSAAMTAMLILVEYATFDSQTAIGEGAVYLERNSDEQRSGKTAHLGDKSGNGEGKVKVRSVVYRGEENLWGNNETWLEGFNNYDDVDNNIHELYYADHDFVDDMGTGPYKKFMATPFKGYGWPSAICYDGVMDALFIASECSGADNWGLCDRFLCYADGKKTWHISTSGSAADTYAGATGLSFSDTSVYKQADNIARIMYIPGTTVKDPQA